MKNTVKGTVDRTGKPITFASSRNLHHGNHYSHSTQSSLLSKHPVPVLIMSQCAAVSAIQAVPDSVLSSTDTVRLKSALSSGLTICSLVGPSSDCEATPGLEFCAAAAAPLFCADCGCLPFLVAESDTVCDADDSGGASTAIVVLALAGEGNMCFLSIASTVRWKRMKSASARMRVESRSIVFASSLTVLVSLGISVPGGTWSTYCTSGPRRSLASGP